jgi:hypothetical protein
VAERSFRPPSIHRERYIYICIHIHNISTYVHIYSDIHISTYNHPPSRPASKHPDKYPVVIYFFPFPISHFKCLILPVQPLRGSIEERSVAANVTMQPNVSHPSLRKDPAWPNVPRMYLVCMYVAVTCTGDPAGLGLSDSLSVCLSVYLSHCLFCLSCLSCLSLSSLSLPCPISAASKFPHSSANSSDASPGQNGRVMVTCQCCTGVAHSICTYICTSGCLHRSL